MKHPSPLHILAPIAVLAIISCLLVGCLKEQSGHFRMKGDSIPYTVIVVHSFDTTMQCYKEYDEALREAFHKDSLEVSIYNAFADLTTPNAHNLTDQVLELSKSIHADLIITEGNFALYSILESAREMNYHPTIVAGGVTIIMHDWIKGYPRLVLWKDIPDYARILQMACELTNKNYVEVECDSTPMDSVLRDNIHFAISDGFFIDNLNLDREELFDAQYLEGVYRDSIIVHGISAARPDKIAFKNTGRKISLQSIFRQSINYPQVMVKYDAYSDMYCNASERPQFTVLPYEFGDKRHLFVAGYFVPMTTEARDVEGSAAHILRGDTTMTAMAGRHIRQAYMDWPAMQTYGLRYDDFKDNYTILNAPFNVQHPYIARVIPWAIALLIAGAVFIIFNWVFRLRRKHLKELQHIIDRRQLELLGDDTYPFRIDETGYFIIDQQQRRQKNVMFEKDSIQENMVKLRQVELRKMAQKGYGKVIDQLYTSTLTAGTYHLTLPISFNNARNYHWWAFRYLVTEDKETKRLLTTGIMINIDSEKEYEKQIEKHRKANEEMKRHEKFLRNMSHEIRTPLNSIIGFCEMLCQPGIEMNKEEEQSVRDTITNNATRLNHIVNDVLNYSRMQSGRTVFNLEDLDVDLFMDSFVDRGRLKIEHSRLIDENGINKTGKLKLQYHHGRRGMHITADKTLLDMVLKQILSNAVKYTEEGDIHVGYNYNLDTHEIVIYIEDSGKGIRDDQKEEIFTLFYKENQFDKGIGLGLSVAKRITEKMGGRIELSSQLGIGSRFNVIFKVDENL